MCLRKITKKHSHPLKEKIAYKILKVYPMDGPYTDIKTPYKYFPIEIGLTYKAGNKKERISTDVLGITPTYQPGFHVYQTLEDARKALKVLFSFSSYYSLRVFKVRVNKIRYTGIDGTSCADDFKVLKLKNWVADEMTVLEEVKEDATV